MATIAAENNEADSGSSVLASLMSKTDDHDRDERVTGSNNNYDSSAESLLKCNRCDFETISPSALTNHVTISHATTNEVEMEPNIMTENNNPPADKLHRKMFECDVCNMKFSNGANMRRHKMRHTGVKPYECRVCQKRFFRKDHLAEHFTTHTKTLPYHCPICNRGFQRQIAMRAHFQNEHVGQNDLVKSCPLCQYRAGSMKSLRIHFFNRHGIDLDNPGPPGSQSSIIAAAAQQGFPEGSLDQLAQLSGNLSVSVGAANYSDSGDSTGNRSTDNATPPMHFLTPHVEISMADAPGSQFATDENQRITQAQNNEAQRLVNGDSPNSPQSGDSNSNAPSSSHIQASSLRLEQETSLTPSISLIPIKQEPTDDGSYDSSKKNGPINLSLADGAGNLTSLIKVSPLKSLLRDDLKRKIMSKANSSNRGRSTASPNANSADTSPDGATTTNGPIITSTGSEQNESLLWRAMGKKLHCLFCGIAFPDQTLYFLHKGCHSDTNPWKCNICGEQCCNVYEFNSHLLSKSHQ